MSSGKTKGYKKVPMDESDDVTQLRERVKTQLNVSPKDVEVEPDELDVTKGHDKQAEERAIAKSTKNNEGNLTRSLESALKQLLPTVSVSPTVPVKITQCNAKELFDDAPYHASMASYLVPSYLKNTALFPHTHGKPTRCSKKIVLRTSEQIKQGSAIELPQFDPNFFSLDQVHCRYHDCPETKVRNPNHSSKTKKEDLYLCPNHRKEMVDEVTKKCAEKKIRVNFKDCNVEDVNGYTSLIGLIEKAFQHFFSQISSSSEVNGSLAECFLNVRNFFIITNTVLNPDFENLSSALWVVLNMLKLLLNQCDDPKSVENLKQLLRDCMEIILPFFNVVYDWVVLPLQRNPGAQIGAGIGGAAGAATAGVGAFAAGAALGPALAVVACGAGIGYLSGALIGAGIFNLNKGNHDQRCYTYHFTGNSDGSLSVQVFSS